MSVDIGHKGRVKLSKHVLHIVWASYNIEVELTMNMAEYTSSCQF